MLASSNTNVAGQGMTTGGNSNVEIVKFVTADWRTHGGQAWEIGKSVSIPEARRGTTLCTNGLLHAYHSVEQALLMDPVHGSFGESARVLRATTPEIVADDGTKLGVHEITLVEEIARPEWWTAPAIRHRVQVQFAVLCARAVLHLYEDRYPTDKRPRQAIEAAEAYLADELTSAVGAVDAAVDAANATATATYAAYAAANAAVTVDAIHTAGAAYAAACSAACSANAGFSRINTAALGAEAVQIVSSAQLGREP